MSPAGMPGERKNLMRHFIIAGWLSGTTCFTLSTIALQILEAWERRRRR